jgi:hypothetical protein
MVASAIIRRRRGSTSLLSLYSALGIRPDLALDFDNERYFVDRVPTTFASAITHTRASTATYVDSTGTLQTAAINEPRVGHHVWNGTAWVNEGLLHESEARTNLLTYSEDLSNAAWTKNTGITIGTPVTRKGISLDLIENDGINNFRNVTRSIGSVGNGSYATFCCFIEAGTSDETAIRIDDVVSGASSNRVTVPITWTAGVPSLQADVTLGLTFVDASLQDYGDGLYRVHLTVLNNTGGALTFYPKYFVQWDNTAAAVNTYAGGFQAEIGPTPSSYIPTSGSTVTRSADVLTIPAANLPWPAPVVIGPELVTNGTFDTDTTGWTAGSGATLSVVSGQLNVFCPAPDTFVNANQAISTVAGGVYKIVATKVSQDASSDWGVATTPTGARFAEFVRSETGTKEFVFVAQGSTTYIQLSSQAADGTAIYDNISVREINPLAVSIQMDGRVTYADTDEVVAVNFVRWQADASNRIFTFLTTSGGATGQAGFQQVSGGVVDNAQEVGNTFTGGINVPFNIASRHGSTFINGAVNGTALTANTTPVSLADLSATNLSLGPDYNGTIRTFRIWAQDIGDAGLVEATEPSLVPSLSLTFDGTENSFVVLDWSE